MKKIIKTLTVIITLAMVMSFIPVSVFAEEAADGSYSVDTTYMVLRPGETGYITVSADNAAGRVDWNGSGSVSASDYAFLDNGDAVIAVTADQVGSGTVTITPTDIATYGGNPINYGYTVQIDVVGEDGVADGNADAADTATAMVAAADDTQENETETTTEEETTTAAAAQGDVLTDGNNDYEDLTEEERLYTTVDGTELYIIRYPRMLDDDGNVVWNDEVWNLEVPEGFELTTVNYKGMDVDAFQYDGQTNVFVLKNLETDECDYYVLGTDGSGFSRLTYITANSKIYIVLDFPEGFEVPAGYQMVELALGNKTVQALKKLSTVSAAETETEETAAEQETTAADAAEETAAAEPAGDQASIVLDEHTIVALNGYETVVSPGLDSADPSEDIYYIYCLVDGKTQLYGYDSVEGTLQRAAIVVYNEIPTEPETVIVYETDPAEVSTVDDSTFGGAILAGIGWNNMQIQVKVLLIALAVAIILIIILIIMFAVMSKKNKKRRKASRGNRPEYRDRGRDRDRDRRNPRDGKIPPRSGNQQPAEEESIFSYVKTENEDDIDLDDIK